MPSRAARLAEYPPRRLVTRVQHFEFTIASSAATGTATIDPVDTGLSVVLFAGFTSPFTGAGMNVNLTRVDLTNATTVTATRNTSTTHAITVRGCVITFDRRAVKSIQQGTVTTGASSTTGTATINAVDTSRSAVFYLGCTTANTSTTPSACVASVTLTNSTTVTVDRGSSAVSTSTCGYAVVEFTPWAVKSVQQFSTAYTSSSASETQAITAVDTKNSVIVWGGVHSAVSTEQDSYYRAELTSSTQVTLTRQGTSTSSRTVRYTVLELNPGFIRQMQRGTATIASSGTSGTTTISPTILRQTALFWGHYAPGGSVDNALYANVKLQDTTTVASNRNTSASNTVVTAYEAAEFA